MLGLNDNNNNDNNNNDDDDKTSRTPHLFLAQSALQ